MYVINIKLKTVVISIFILISMLVALVFANVGNDETDVPIIMYHHFLNEEARLGKYVISEKQFSDDIKYLKDKGYETVFIKDLVDYVYNGKELPKKPVVITFDDGYESNYSYIYPKLKAENIKVVISLIGKYSDEYTKLNDSHVNYAHIKWDEVKEMHSSGMVEFANHTYDMHTLGKRKGTLKLKSESLVEYEKNLTEDLLKVNNIIKETTGETPVTFTYPFGYADKNSYKIIKKIGFLSTLSCSEGMNKIIRNAPECLYLLKRYNRTSNISTKDFFDKVGI